MAFGEDFGVHLFGSTFECARRSSRSSSMADLGVVTAMGTYAESERRIRYVAGLADRVTAGLNRRIPTKREEEAKFSSLISWSKAMNDRSESMKTKVTTLLAVVERLESRCKFSGVRQFDVPAPSPVRSDVPFYTQYDQDLSHLDYRIWNQIPVFDGSSPFGWIARAERFFRVCQIVEEEKLDWMSLCFEGDALFWYMRELASRDFMNWCEFKRRLVARFASVKSSSRKEVKMQENLCSQIVAEPKSSCANISLEIETTSEDVKSRKEEAIQQPDSFPTEVSSISVQESSHTDKLLEGFDMNLVPEDQQLAISGVLSPIFAGLHSEMAQIDEKSNGIQFSHSGYEVYDQMLLREEVLRQAIRQQKRSKSWMFKYKPEKPLDLQTHLALQDSEVNKDKQRIANVFSRFQVHQKDLNSEEEELQDTTTSQWEAYHVLQSQKSKRKDLHGSWEDSTGARDPLHSRSSLHVDDSKYSPDKGIQRELVFQPEEKPYVLQVEVNDLLLKSIACQDNQSVSQMFDSMSLRLPHITSKKKQMKCFKSWRFKFKKKRHQRVMSRHEHHLFDRINLRLVCKLKMRCFQGNLRLDSQSIIQFFLTVIFLLRAEVAGDLAHFAFGHKQYVKVAAASYGKFQSSSLLPSIAKSHDSGSATVVSLHTSPLIRASTDRQTVAREARICSSPLGLSELRHGTPLVYDPSLYSYSGIMHASASKGVVHHQRLLVNVAYLQCVRAMFALATDLSPCIASLGRHKFCILGSEQVVALPSKPTEFKLLLSGSPDSGQTSLLVSVSGSELGLFPLSTIYIWSRDHLYEPLPDGTERSQEFVPNREEKEKFALENLAICHHSSTFRLNSFRVMLGDKLVYQYLTMKTWRFKYKQLELLAMIVLERQPAISISLWRAFFLAWYCGKDQLLQQMGIDEGLFHQFIEENTIWSDYVLFLLTPVLLLEISSWESEKDKRQNVMGMRASRLRHNNLLIQLTCNLLLQLLYMGYKTVNTGGQKFFAIWHRWRIRDCVQGVYCIVE